MDRIYEMSVMASYVMIIVLIIRLMLRRSPKIFSFVLWYVVLFRLLCPFTIQSDISLVKDLLTNDSPSADTEYSYSGVRAENVRPDVISPAVTGDEENDIVITYQPQQPEVTVKEAYGISGNTENLLAAIWVLGTGCMALYGVLSLNILRQKLFGAMKTKDGYYECDDIDTPFVLGIVRPKIYLPINLTSEEKRYILEHERHHIERFDHITKILFFIALCIHWFNPLVWISFTLFTKDMEMSCDEAVMKKMGEGVKADYSLSLLKLSSENRRIKPSPLAFGENNTKERIVNLAKYKRPKVMIVILSAVVIILAGITLLTDPDTENDFIYGSNYKVKQIIYDVKMVEDELIEEMYLKSLGTLQITAGHDLFRSYKADMDEFIAKDEEYYLTRSELESYAGRDNAWSGKIRGKITDSRIYRTEDDMFYLIFRTDKGNIYAAYGWEDVSERGEGASDDTFVSYIHELESAAQEEEHDSEFFDNTFSAITGDKVFTMGIVSDKDTPGYFIAGFEGLSDDMRSTEYYGYGVFRTYEDGKYTVMTDMHIYEGAATAENGIYLCEDAAVLSDGEGNPENTYDIIFCTKGNVYYVIRLVDDGEKTVQNKYVPQGGFCMIPHEDEKDGVKISTVFYDLNGSIIGQSYSKVNGYGAKEPFGRTYVVKEVSYITEKRTEDIRTGSPFLLGKDMSLYRPSTSDPSGFQRIGQFEVSHISPANFDGYFKEDRWMSEKVSAEYLRENKQSVRELRSGNVIYHLFVTLADEIYLTSSFTGDVFPEYDENMYAKWCVRLGEVSSAETSAGISRYGYIYHAPHLSSTPDSLPEYGYTIHGEKFTVTRGSEIISGDTPIKKSPFPWSDEEWEKLFILCPENFKVISEKYSSLYWQNLGGRYFLIYADDEVFIVDMPEKISTVYALKEEKTPKAFEKSSTPYGFTKNITPSDITFAVTDARMSDTGSAGENMTEEDIAEFIRILNGIPKSSFRKGSCGYDADIMLYSGGREILFTYDKEKKLVRISFDSETAKLFGDKSYVIENESLNGFFERQIALLAEGTPFVDSADPHHMMKNLYEDFAFYKELSVKDQEGYRNVIRSLTDKEYSTLLSILQNLPKDCFTKAEYDARYTVTLRDSFGSDAIYLGYTPGESTVYLSGSWNIRNMMGESDWKVDNEELEQFFKELTGEMSSDKSGLNVSVACGGEIYSLTPTHLEDDERAEDLSEISLKSDDGKLLITLTPSWPTDSLMISQEYYEQTSPDSVHIDTKTAGVKPGEGEDSLTMIIPHRNRQYDEKVRIFVKGEEGRYAFIVNLLKVS